MDEDMQKEILDYLVSFFYGDKLGQIINEHKASLKDEEISPISDGSDPYYLKSYFYKISQNVLEKGNLLADLQQIFNTSSFVIEILDDILEELYSRMQEYFPYFPLSVKSGIEAFFEEKGKFLSSNLDVLGYTVARAYLRARLLENLRAKNVLSERKEILTSLTLMREGQKDSKTIDNENNPYEFAVKHGLLKKVGQDIYTPIFEDGMKGLNNVLARWYELSEENKIPMPTYDDLSNKLIKANGGKYNKDTIRNYLSELRSTN